MRILYVNGLHTGGTKIVVNNIIREISKTHDVRLLCGIEEYTSPRFSARDEIRNGVPTRLINIRRLRNNRVRRNYYNPRFNQPFLEFVKSFEPDLIHFHSIQPFGANVIEETVQLYIPFCLTMHEWWWLCPRNYLVDIHLKVCSQYMHVEPSRCYCVGRNFELKRFRYLQNVLERIRYILVPSRYIKENLELHGVGSGKMIVNENGIVPPEAFKRRPVSHPLRFGFFGGGAGYKGDHILIRALREINEGKGVINAYNFKVMSEYREKKRYRNFFRVVRQVTEKLRDEPYDKSHQIIRYFRDRKLLQSTENIKIHFFPPFSDHQIDEVFSGIDVLLLPSVMKESYSLVVREAMIRGIPVISSDCGGPEEIIRDGYNGYIFKTGDYIDLAEKMARLILNPGLVERFSRNIDAAQIVTVEQQVQHLESLYTQIVSSWNKRP